MPLYRELSIGTQTAYADLLDVTHSAEIHRGIADLKGGFARKSIKGNQYWYYQYREAGTGNIRQIYVGPDTERVQKLRQQAEQGRLKPSSIPAMARAVIAMNGMPVLPKHFRVIRQLADYGFFRAGGVLIGPHAFLVIGNMLGVRWHVSERTQDLDFAHAGNRLAVGLKADLPVNVHEAIESLEMGFLPFKAMTGEIGGGYRVPDEEAFRLDFVTTTGRGDAKVVEIPNIPVGFQPLKFMELPLEQPDQAVVFSPEGALVVNVPQPARFAIHKLIVFGERTRSFRVKANKDIEQAGALLDYLLDHRPDELLETWNQTAARGKGWRKRMRDGLLALVARFPEIGERLPPSHGEL